ncbi:uncharacterized protein [Glycine max]|uniref:uncharacterized protein n=1 Tax=Glycine max TaxID=3847 RepID=UPI0003DEAEF8|nr:uncharacterized protein LOC102667168 [Glycine max]|eukprot:XP_006589923.1 uncharacterized protein LOC102667168 [Glycine max]
MKKQSTISRSSAEVEYRALATATFNIISATNVTAQVNSIPMLNGTNFKVRKEGIEIVLGCMDLDLALRTERPISTPETSNEGQNTKKFLEEIEQYFAKNEKAETSNLLAKLISMKYKGKGNIREYIMEMSNLASKLKSLKLELGEDLLVHLVLISLPAHFGQFKGCLWSRLPSDDERFIFVGDGKKVAVEAIGTF